MKRSPAAQLQQQHVTSLQDVGSVDLAEIPAAEGALRRSELDAHSATVYQLAQPAVCGSGSTGNGAAANGPPGGGDSKTDVGGGGMLLVSCSRAVHPERSWAWARGVLEALQPQDSIVVSTMPANQFRGDGDAANDTLVFAVATSAAAVQQPAQPAATAADGAGGGGRGPAGGGGMPPPLPSGTLLSGVAAAIVSYCQASCPHSNCSSCSRHPSRSGPIMALMAKTALPASSCNLRHTKGRYCRQQVRVAPYQSPYRTSSSQQLCHAPGAAAKSHA